jgi:hypothetical protein
MKKFGILTLLLTLMMLGCLSSCTNDEGEPEYETLTPVENQE